MSRPSLLLRALSCALLLLRASCAGVPLTCTRAPFTSLPFCNASLPTSARVADAVSRMPLSEKLSAMYRPFGSPFVTCSGGGGAPSLGIGSLPATSECVHGVAWGCTPGGLCPTLFPNGGALGASFNRSLWRAVGSTIGDEQRALANLNGQPSGYSCWSPQINLARDVRREGRAGDAGRGRRRGCAHTDVPTRRLRACRRAGLAGRLDAPTWRAPLPLFIPLACSRAGAGRKKSRGKIRTWSLNLASSTSRG